MSDGSTFDSKANGETVQSYPDLGLDFIAVNHFIAINVTHGDC